MLASNLSTLLTWAVALVLVAPGQPLPTDASVEPRVKGILKPIGSDVAQEQKPALSEARHEAVAKDVPNYIAVGARGKAKGDSKVNKALGLVTITPGGKGAAHDGEDSAAEQAEKLLDTFQSALEIEAVYLSLPHPRHSGPGQGQAIVDTVQPVFQAASERTGDIYVEFAAPAGAETGPGVQMVVRDGSAYLADEKGVPSPHKSFGTRYPWWYFWVMLTKETSYWASGKPDASRPRPEKKVNYFDHVSYSDGTTKPVKNKGGD